MKIITERGVEELLRRVNSYQQGTFDLRKELEVHLEELNAWNQISTAPKDRRVLLFYPERKNGYIYPMSSEKIVGKWSHYLEIWLCDLYPIWHNDKSITVQPTHWQELPENPKD